jgi:hypothetical protein
MSESFFPTDFVEIGDDVLAGRLVHVAQGHEDARQTAVPVRLLLVMVNGPGNNKCDIMIAIKPF